MVFRLILTFAVFLALALPAHAAEPLIFRDQAGDSREKEVIAFLEAQKLVFAELPFRIAATDLNGDGVKEWIVRQDRESACVSNAACDFAIAALSQGKPVLLGQFKAAKVEISRLKAYGVVRLEVYNKVNNDFDYTVFWWEPSKSAFVPVS